MGSTGINAAMARLFGLRLVSDIPERLCDLGLPTFVDEKRRLRLQAIERAGILFIHVPKNAGMAISDALYGQQIKHASVRYYAKVAPELLRNIDSVAVVRHPVERFVSAFDYARSGGSSDNSLSAPFRAQYTAFRCLDEALDCVEGASSPYSMDHIFRPQIWYVADAAGVVLVRRLVRFECLANLNDIVGRSIARTNRRTGPKTKVTSGQAERILRLYCDDVALAAQAGDARFDSLEKPMSCGCN